MRLLLLILSIGSFVIAQDDLNLIDNPLLRTTPSTRPLWTLDIRRDEPVKDALGPHIATDGERIFYLQAEQVKVVDAETGRQVWAFRIGKWAQLRYASGRLLAITEQGKVYALEPTTGRVRWTRVEGSSGGYAVDRNALYIAGSEGLTAISLESGRTRWTTRVPYFSPFEPFTVVKNRIFVFTVSGDAMSAQTSMFDVQTGKHLGEASTRGPLAILNQRMFFRNDWFLIDFPDRVYINVHDLRTGKLLEDRTYRVENRVEGNNWNSKVAIAGAVYISGGGNIACFPPSTPGGKAKPNFIRVPRGDVQWLAGPRNGTFLLEWQNNLWLVRQKQQPCTPIVLQEQGIRLTAGNLARTDIVKTRTDTIKNGMYIGFENGTFYAVNTKTGEVELKLALRNYTFGPTHVVGNTLVVQTGNELLAFALPRNLKP